MNALSHVSTVLCTCCEVIMMVAMSVYDPLWLLECSDNSTPHNRWNWAGWSACRCTARLTPGRRSNAQRDEVNERLGLGRVTQVEAIGFEGEKMTLQQQQQQRENLLQHTPPPDRDTSAGNWSGTASANGKIDRCIGRSSEERSRVTLVHIQGVGKLSVFQQDESKF